MTKLNTIVFLTNAMWDRFVAADREGKIQLVKSVQKIVEEARECCFNVADKIGVIETKKNVDDLNTINYYLNIALLSFRYGEPETAKMAFEDALRKICDITPES